ncbi:MAG: ferritin-like domain-containing protein [Weeksellaceae bacterium]|nr:ferritin-like domain-containing protein [Weeksellaceae bacterium]
MSKKETTKAAKADSNAKPAKAKKEEKAPKVAKSKSAKFIEPKEGAAETLRDLFLDGLKDLYWAENHLIKGFEKLHANATSEELQTNIKEHISETKKHIKRLDEAFSKLGEKAEAEECAAMKGLLEEAEHIVEETQPGAVRDAGIIIAIQKIEHYEIASYGSLAVFAKQMGEDEVERILRDTLNEEKATNNILTNLAVNKVNTKAK